jgi:hypothetical protein
MQPYEPSSSSFAPCAMPPRCILDACPIPPWAISSQFHSFTRGSLTCFGYLRWTSFTKVSTASSPSRCSQGSHDAFSGGYPCQNTKYSTRFALRLSRLFAIDSTTQNFLPSMTSGGGGSCRRQESSRFDMVELLRQALRREMPGHGRPASWILSGLANVDSAGRIHCISGILYASRTSFILSV